jgi:hypothetical protein
MKKFCGMIAFLCLLLAFFGCASKPPASGGMPPNVANARRNAPEDVLVGIGSAKLGLKSQTRIIAANRARQEIATSMSSMVKSMIRDYTASSEVDPQAALAFQENITVTLSKADLSGATIQFEEPDDEGYWWVVMYLNKANVVKEISQAQAEARLRVGALASFDAEKRMNDGFEQLRKEEGY